MAKKSKQIVDLLNDLSKNIGGNGYNDINCSMCAKLINMENFKDELSKKEYKISKMCQECQDKIWG